MKHTKNCLEGGVCNCAIKFADVGVIEEYKKYVYVNRNGNIKITGSKYRSAKHAYQSLISVAYVIGSLDEEYADNLCL